MKLILYPLLLLVLVGTFNLIFVNNTVNYAYNSATAFEASGNQTLTGTTSVLQQQQTSINLNIDMTTGLIILIIVFVTVGVLAGIRILGSGLSSYSVQLIHKATVYYGLWSIFSAFSITSFTIIPIFGLFIWFGLTLIYTIGFFQTLNSGAEDDD